MKGGKTLVAAVLAMAMALFLGILIYVWIEANRANPVLLDEQGRPKAAVLTWSA